MKKVSNYLAIGGLVLGLFLGLIIPSSVSKIAFIGTYYINALKILIGPVIFASIGLSIIQSRKENSKLLVKTVLLFIVMFVSTFLLTSLIVMIIQPGKGFVFEEGVVEINYASFNFGTIIKNLFPTSLKNLLMGKNTFFIIIMSIIVSLVLSFTKLKTGYTLMLLSIKNFLNKILTLIMFFTPFAVVSLVSNLIANYGKDIIALGAKYILFAYAGSILAIIVIMILPVWLFAHINPIEYIKKVSKVWLITLTTCSSVATLPHTIKICEEEFSISDDVTNIVVPLGCTIHMCGGAVSFSLLGLFVCQMFNVQVTLGMYLLMIISATLINMAAPGIPNGGVVIGFTYLSLLGLPITSFYGFYSGIYKLLDMAYTTLNVTGDISANILLSHKWKK